MSPERTKAWVDSLTEVVITDEYKDILVVAEGLPLMFGRVKTNVLLLLCFDDNLALVWSIDDSGIIMPVNRPRNADVLSALNLGEGWQIIGTKQPMPNTSIVQNKFSPQ